MTPAFVLSIADEIDATAGGAGGWMPNVVKSA
jgi:hypothetical protein